MLAARVRADLKRLRAPRQIAGRWWCQFVEDNGRDAGRRNPVLQYGRWVVIPWLAGDLSFKDGPPVV